jgi:antibiotic biosynthesis monooxygenase (ABM) superfamily enzyme
MKCPVCQIDVKDDAKTCKKCGVDLNQAPMWRPTWKWHLSVLAVIYVALIIAYFAISHFLKKLPPPYRLRDIPKEITPWIKS